MVKVQEPRVFRIINVRRIADRNAIKTRPKLHLVAVQYTYRGSKFKLNPAGGRRVCETGDSRQCARADVSDRTIG